MALALNLGGTIALSCVEDRPVPLSGRQVLKNCRIEIREIAPVQSYALEWTHVLRTRDEINLAYAEGERRFMVLTGTDSAEDLIYLLDMLRPSDAAVVVLVSMRTAAISDPRPDGLDGALAWLEGARPGVALCWGDDLIEGPFVEKIWNEKWCFRPIGWSGGLDRWQVEPGRKLPESIPTVPIFSTGLGTGRWLAEQLETGSFEGAVVEAFASGDVPPDGAHAIARVIRSGRPIVLASRSRPGCIRPGFPGLVGTSHELLKLGALGAARLDAHRARLRLILALAGSSTEDAGRAFASYRL